MAFYKVVTWQDIGHTTPEPGVRVKIGIQGYEPVELDTDENGIAQEEKPLNNAWTAEMIDAGYTTVDENPVDLPASGTVDFWVVEEG